MRSADLLTDMRCGVLIAAFGRMRPTVRSVAAVTVLTVALFGCAASDSFDSRVLRMDQSVETIRNGLILTNIIRASFSAPLSFMSVPIVHGSTMLGATAGVPTFTFGPGQTAEQGQYAFGPNSLTASGTTSFDVAPLDSRDFYRGLLTTLSLDTIGFFLEQGFPREVLLYLALDRIVLGHGLARQELKNDPRSPSFSSFSDRVQLALELGLTVEGAGGKTARFCFDPSLAFRPLDGARPVCGAGGGDGLSLGRAGPGATPEIEVDLRSTQGIFYALGRSLRAPTEEQSIVPDPSHKTRGEPLFEVETGTPNHPCLARADYDGITYCVPLGRGRNSALAIGLLAQLLALNTSINDLPLTSTVRITP
jgi:hypothetical protein